MRHSLFGKTLEEIEISIHAPVWGATSNMLKTVDEAINFNPRTRMGCDKTLNESLHELKIISIHAPVWGATIKVSSETVDSQDFNPRTRMGCDRQDLCLCVKCLRFQSTHPYGVRLWKRSKTLLGFVDLAIFQSTHPYGVRRDIWSKTSRINLISIHAPVWGATCTLMTYSCKTWISIHAPVWGATFKSCLRKRSR